MTQTNDRWLARLRRLSLAFGHALHTYWGFCATCREHTPWHTEAWKGTYRCHQCGTDQLDAKRAA